MSLQSDVTQFQGANMSYSCNSSISPLKSPQRDQCLLTVTLNYLLQRQLGIPEQAFPCTELRGQRLQGLAAALIPQIRQHAGVLVSDCLGDRGNMAPSCTNTASCYEMGLPLLVGCLTAVTH